ncbi:transglutaminase family protein [Streptomyces sp. NPDC087850]|uniref:transglutaminase-like domain-containing protein n=1 Tax=Streptomyces sp. NPDC087850 TaxID=3365809 RepID=UPI0038093AB9
MQLMQRNPDLAAYLAADEVIDHEHPLVRETATRLRAETADAYSYVRAAYEFVRDTIPHSFDVNDPRVTWRASDVLGVRTGICYAKSHALVALLRAESLPAGLCYQLLAAADGTGPMVVHGLIAVRLPGRTDWSRLDPRGNRPGVDARFAPESERLAFPLRPEFHERDHEVLYDVPHPAVLSALKAAPDADRLRRALPTELSATA